MDEEELADFRTEFGGVGLRDKDQLRQWFLNYPELSIQEQSLIIGKCEKQTRNIKQNLGSNNICIVETNSGLLISRRISNNKKQVQQAPSSNISEWVKDQYTNNNQSIRSLSRAVNRSRNYIRTILRSKSTNPVSTPGPVRSREWLLEHYINQRMSLRQCAKIAGVAHCTIRDWLTKFNIQSRDVYSSAHRKVRYPIEF